MDRITEELLLEKGSPTASKLEEIKTLNLSRMGLKLQDLPVRLLSRLRALERWDLSGNRLQEFPKTLKLPALRYLDLSDNQMEDVTSLESLGGLEELRMEDNLYVTVSDNYKLMVLLPSLRVYNGKDVSSTANHLRYVYSNNLRTRIIGVWERSFSLPHPISAEKMSHLEKSFVNAACQQVKYGPSSVSDFTKWKVEILARQYLRSLVESEDLDSKENNAVSAPQKRKQAQPATDTNIRLTPHKKARSDPPAEEGPHKSRLRLETVAGIRISPRKAVRGPAAPTRAPTKADTTRKGPAAAPHKEEEAPAGQGAADSLPIAGSGTQDRPACLKPLHVLQCHSKQDSSDDFSTQLWACAFQPLLDSSGNSRMVATCGGDSVCVIDCETGMVMKKYKVPGEEFFSLAWSTVSMCSGNEAAAQPCSVLAAAGRRGLVKLIHPRNNVAYGEFRASRKTLSVLHFNPQQGNFLFSGAYDNRIVMWDIGGVDSQYNYKVVQLLVLEISATPLHICLPPACPATQLLTACEDGLRCYNTQLSTHSASRRSKEMEITFPIYEEEDEEHNYHTVDGLSFLTDDIVASKSYMHACIYLWSWSRTAAQRPARKSRAVCAVVLAELQWASTDIPYLALNTCPRRAYVVCGDDKGQMWTYHVTDLQKASFQPGEAILPTEVLEWPAPMRKGFGQIDGPSINVVAMDPELRYLVALSDKNMVIIWRREDS